MAEQNIQEKVEEYEVGIFFMQIFSNLKTIFLQIPDVNGTDPDQDYLVTERELYDTNQPGGRRLSETLFEMAGDIVRSLTETKDQSWGEDDSIY